MQVCASIRTHVCMHAREHTHVCHPQFRRLPQIGVPALRAANNVCLYFISSVGVLSALHAVMCMTVRGCNCALHERGCGGPFSSGRGQQTAAAHPLPRHCTTPPPPCPHGPQEEEVLTQWLVEAACQGRACGDYLPLMLASRCAVHGPLPCTPHMSVRAAQQRRRPHLPTRACKPKCTAQRMCGPQCSARGCAPTAPRSPCLAAHTWPCACIHAPLCVFASGLPGGLLLDG